MNHKVSVIIPTFNYAHFLDDCLKSVLNQSYNNIEIIVVDDGSDDYTKEVVNKYGNKIVYIYQDNRGLSAARNKGIENSTGEYIQLLDSDDILHQYAIKHKLSQIKESGVGFVVCKSKDFTKIDYAGRPITNGEWRLFTANLDIHLCYFNIAPIHAFLVSKKVINDVGFFDTTLQACEDYDYWIRALEKGYVPKYSDKGLVYYRKHKESMTMNHFNQYYHDAILHIRLYDKLFVANTISINNKFACSLAFICGLLITVKRWAETQLSVYEISAYKKLCEKIENTYDNVFAILNGGVSTDNVETYLYLIRFLNIVNKHYKNNEFIFNKTTELLELMETKIVWEGVG